MFKEIRSRSYKSWIKPMSRDIQHLTDSKFEEIKTMFLKELKDLDILFLAEMFCSSKITDSFYNIPGYALFYRVGKKGHGILAFIANSTFVKKRSNFQVSDIE